MIKKLVALAATALFSLNASAGYVQYDFHYGAPNRGLDGFIVQHDTDQSIAYFSFRLDDPVDNVGRFGQSFFPVNNEGCICLVSASTYFRNNGPTNFSISDSFGGDHFTKLDVTFSRGTSRNFVYTAKYAADLYSNQPQDFFSGTLSGLATRGTVDPLLANYLDSIGGYDFALQRIVPEFIKRNEVPEPTSIALLALGAVGLTSARRRKQTH